MRSEDLLRLASPHGVDLVEAAGRTPPDVKRQTETKIKRRYGQFTQILLEPPQNKARGSGSGSSQRPQWTIAELGQAAMGVPKLYFNAALYAFAGDSTQYHPLWKSLYAEACKLAEREDWPATVRDIHGVSVPYVEHLAKLVLDEDSMPFLFTLAGGSHIYAIYLHTDVRTWEAGLNKKFEALRDIWISWIESAARIMQPRLYEG